MGNPGTRTLTCHPQNDCLLCADAVPVADYTGDLRAVVSGSPGFERQCRAVSLRDGCQRRRLIKDCACACASADERAVLFPSSPQPLHFRVGASAEARSSAGERGLPSLCQSWNRHCRLLGQT